MSSIALVICPPFWHKMPPLGLAYISSALRHAGHDVTVFDLNVFAFHRMPQDVQTRWLVSHDLAFQDNLYDYSATNHGTLLHEYSAQILDGDYEVIGFSVFRSNRRFSIQLARALKVKNPNSVIVFGGPEVMAHKLSGYQLFSAEDQQSIDYMVIGEGETSFLSSLDTLHTSDGLSQLIHSSHNDDINTLRTPTFDAFDLTQYVRKRALPVLASRGCVRTCAFCSERLLYEGFRMRSVGSIVDELEEHVRVRNINWFTFHDSLINGDVEILKGMCKEIIRRQLAIHWEAQVLIRSEMTTDLFALMKQAGCFNMFVGLESGSDSVLRIMRKGFSANMARTFFMQAQAAGLHCEVSLIVGYPGESEKMFQETLDFLNQHKAVIPKIAQVNPFLRIPGTSCAEAGCDATAPTFNPVALERVNRMIAFFKEEDLRFTPAFINNLAYGTT